MSKNILDNYKEHRPKFHFTPSKGWMNDPNGLIFDGDNYHLYFQYYPHDTIPGPMHWGHATSKNLIHWENKDIALYPTEKGVIYSGSAVMDKKNTSGFGCDNQVPLVVMFTYHQEVKENDVARVIQSQGLAYSLDKGKTFTHYEHNPVLTNSNPDFRDPKVFWHEETEKWVAILVAGNKTIIYNSDNLKDWFFLSEFKSPSPNTDVLWECPDLIRVRVEGTNRYKWVLIVSASTKDNDKYGMLYFVGEFDGHRFINETDKNDTFFIDFTFDNYAAVSFSGLEERVIVLGWMNCWHYGRNIPAVSFNGTMTIPRELTLYPENDKMRLRQTPIDEFSQIYGVYSKYLAANEIELPSGPVMLEIQMDRNDYEIVLGNDTHNIKVIIDSENSMIAMDRRGCGNEALGKDFYRVYSDAYNYNDKINLKILVDVTSIELFLDEGKRVGTLQYFIDKPFTTLSSSEILKEIGMYALGGCNEEIMEECFNSTS